MTLTAFKVCVEFSTMTNVSDINCVEISSRKNLRLEEIQTLPLREKCPYAELFCSAFSRIRTKCGEVRSISLCIQSECGKMWTSVTPNTDTLYVSVQAHHPVEKNQILSIFLCAIYLYKELLCQLF